MALGDYFSNTSDSIANLNQQWLFKGSGVISRIELYQETFYLDDSGNRIYMQGLGSSMVLGSRQRGGLGGYAAYEAGFGSTEIILNANGNINDTGPNNVTITATGTPIFANDIHISGAFTFAGSAAFYLNIPLAALPTSAGTFESWYRSRLTAHNADKNIIMAGANGFGGGGTAVPEMSLYIDATAGTGNPAFQATISGAYIFNLKDTSTVITSGTKIHLAGTWNGSGNYAYLYVNGAPKASGIQLNNIEKNAFIGFKVGMCNRQTDPNNSAAGDVDEVRISNKARPVHELNYLQTFLGDSRGERVLVGPSGLVI